MPLDDEVPRRRDNDRRGEDYVTFRDMVEYVTESDSRYHAARAESLIAISNAMEKSHETMVKSIGGIATTIKEHEVWHRDVLQSYLDRATSNRTAIFAVAISALACLLSLIGTAALFMSR